MTYLEPHIPLLCMYSIESINRAYSFFNFFGVFLVSIVSPYFIIVQNICSRPLEPLSTSEVYRNQRPSKPQSRERV